MKRYQNPDVFEPLAMAYAVGTLQGRARKRFQKLMGQHFYLRVVTEAYERQFAGLVGLLPAEEPPPAVWQRLEQELGLNTSAAQPRTEVRGKSSWLRLEWLHWPAMAVASVMAALITALFMGNMQPEAQVYFSKLTSPDLPVVAMAAAKRDEMAITVTLADAMPVRPGVMPTLWCLSKNPHEKPLRMGTLKPAGQSRIAIQSWQNLSDVSQLAISLEPIDQAQAQEPMGEVIYKGTLMAGQ